MQQTTNNQQFRLRKNYQIKAAQVRLIDSDGTNLGITTIQDALRQAREQGLDLVEIGKGTPIICKIADYGKMQYEEKKKQQAAKKNQVIQEIKELFCRPNTDIGDFDRLIKQAREFLENNCKVKFSIKFRGREIAHTELGQEKINFALEQLSDVIMDRPQISMEGKVMSILFLPKK